MTALVPPTLAAPKDGWLIGGSIRRTGQVATRENGLKFDYFPSFVGLNSIVYLVIDRSGTMDLRYCPTNEAG
ncbi:MAG: hypothetical protein ABI832_22640 [bacterium]